jgi:hypothetical protein
LRYKVSLERGSTNINVLHPRRVVVIFQSQEQEKDVTPRLVRYQVKRFALWMSVGRPLEADGGGGITLVGWPWLAFKPSAQC